MEKIQIHLGDENRIYIEKDVEHSPLFAEQYEQLIRKMAEYISSASKNGDTIEYNSLNENNIFLINGERGSGKTSMLVSMHRHMQQKDNVFEKKFLCLHVIDPSSFTNNANILQIIIAELFKAFKEGTKDKTIGYEAKNAITGIFVEIKHALCILESSTLASKMDDSDIESLTDMSNAMDLEELIKRLVTKMLGVLEKDKLLVCIDDLDVNTTHAYDMLEQIRKYLILPKVVILIAAKTKQLLEVVLQHFLIEYRPLISSGTMTIQDVQEMSNKYLLKLLPLDHRVDLDSAIEKFKYSIEIIDKDKVIESSKNGSELIYKLIYKKTGLQYLQERDGINYIIPNNLRAFRFLIRILCDMDMAKKERNIELYQQYFLSEWLPQNLQKGEQDEVKALLNISDVSKVNKLIIQCIADKINFIEYPQEISTLVDVMNVYANVSLGDVMAVMIWGKRVNGSDQFAKYIYAIKHAYNILLEKSYREMLREEELLKKVRMYSGPDNEEYINTYQRLVGGSLLNGYTWDYLLPPINNTENRLHRVIAVNSPIQPQLSGGVMLSIIMTPDRSKNVNSGEAYRKQIPIYYLQPITMAHKQVIIDWFNPLYTIPFDVEQLSRFGEEGIKSSLMEELTSKGDSETHTYKAFMEMAIHSVDFLERIYWHIRAKRDYLRTGQDRTDIYKKLLRTISEVSFDEYISAEDKRSFERLMRTIMSFFGKEREIIEKFLESDDMQAPIKPIKYPFDRTLKRCKTVDDVKGNMRRINVPKGYKAEWIDSEIDKLGFTDEEIQRLSPNVIRDRLKQIAKK